MYLTEYFVYYTVGCRDCLGGDPIKKALALNDEDYHEKFFLKTEYEAVKVIEEFRKENNMVCAACGSENVEVLDVEVDNKPFYSNDIIESRKARIYHITLDKKGSKVKYKRFGTLNLEPRFEREAFKRIFITIGNIPDERCVSKNLGRLSCCLTGSFNQTDLSKFEFQIERLQHYGFSKSELYKQLLPFVEEYGAIKPEKSPKQDLFEGEVFQGFYFWATLVDDEDKAKAGGYSAVNLYFQYGKNIIVYPCENYESASQMQWDSNFRNSLFQIDSEREPILIKGQKAYYSKLVSGPTRQQVPKQKWWKRLFRK